MLYYPIFLTLKFSKYQFSTVILLYILAIIATCYLPNWWYRGLFLVLLVLLCVRDLMKHKHKHYEQICLKPKGQLSLYNAGQCLANTEIKRQQIIDWGWIVWLSLEVNAKYPLLKCHKVLIFSQDQMSHQDWRQFKIWLRHHLA